MWHPWFKPTTVALASNGIAVRRRDNSVQQLVQNDHCFEGEKALLEALDTVHPFIPHGTVRFVISHHYVRYIALPWQTGMVSRQDWQALAEHTFKKRFGTLANDWQVRISLNGYGQAVTACAISHQFIAHLESLAKEHRWKIVAIEPLLMAISQHMQLTADQWVLIAEPERVLLCEYAQQGWQQFAVLAPPRGEETKQTLQQIQRDISQPVTNARSAVEAWVSPELSKGWQSDQVQIRMAPPMHALHNGSFGNSASSNSALWMAGF